MDERFNPGPVAGWYMVAAIASLLLMAVAAAIYATHHLFVDMAHLPLDQQQAFRAEPAWVRIAGGAAVLTGFAGAVLLVLRRRAAEPLLMLSLIAIIVWLAGLLLSPLREAVSTNDLAVAIITVLIDSTIYLFARHSRQRGWLR
jgi:Na+/proline symporter